MSTEHLHNQEAIQKLKEMVNKIDIGMMCTIAPGSEYPYAVPMSRQEVDEQGHIWFLFSSESESYRHLQQNPALSLLYADTENYHFLSINGVGRISSDKERINQYWNKIMEAWFQKGKEDPAIRILQFIPAEAHYWDNKSNKLITFLKIAASVVTGQKMDTGREGDLHL